MTAAGNVDGRYAITGKCQVRHSESIAPIWMVIRCVVVMVVLELMGFGGAGCQRDDGGRECRREICGDGNAFMRPFRVDCPHQDGDRMRGCGAGADGVGGGGCLRESGDKERRREVYGDGNMISRTSRVDCPHQVVCGMDIHTAGGDGGRPWWKPMNDGDRQTSAMIKLHANASIRPLRWIAFIRKSVR